jgi:pimeloyl-ACP methyl ester carboxylesterase
LPVIRCNHVDRLYEGQCIGQASWTSNSQWEEAIPKVQVNDVSIAYEIAGKGPPIVWTPGGWFPRNFFTYVFAGRFSANHRVLTWDRRNSGRSDIGIEDAESELHLWCDDLHALLQSLDLSPAYIGGGSACCMTSLLMAFRYPEDVKGLILQDPPTDKIETAAQPLVEHHYRCLAEAAESRGMESVIELSSNPPVPEWAWITGWVAETVTLNPSNRDRLLAIDPGRFAAIMNRWAEWFTTPRVYMANLSDEELAGITTPALVCHGLNDWHPEHTARELYRRLPNAEWVDYADRYTPAEIQEIVDIATTMDFAPGTVQAFRFPYYEDFLRRVESGQFGEMRQ